MQQSFTFGKKTVPLSTIRPTARSSISHATDADAYGCTKCGKGLYLTKKEKKEFDKFITSGKNQGVIKPPFVLGKLNIAFNPISISGNTYKTSNKNGRSFCPLCIGNQKKLCPYASNLETLVSITFLKQRAVARQTSTVRNKKTSSRPTKQTVTIAATEDVYCHKICCWEPNCDKKRLHVNADFCVPNQPTIRVLTLSGLELMNELIEMARVLRIHVWGQTGKIYTAIHKLNLTGISFDRIRHHANILREYIDSQSQDAPIQQLLVCIEYFEHIPAKKEITDGDRQSLLKCIKRIMNYSLEHGPVEAIGQMNKGFGEVREIIPEEEDPEEEDLEEPKTVHEYVSKDDDFPALLKASNTNSESQTICNKDHAREPNKKSDSQTRETHGQPTDDQTSYEGPLGWDHQVPPNLGRDQTPYEEGQRGWDHPLPPNLGRDQTPYEEGPRGWDHQLPPNRGRDQPPYNRSWEHTNWTMGSSKNWTRAFEPPRDTFEPSTDNLQSFSNAFSRPFPVQNNSTSVGFGPPPTCQRTDMWPCSGCAERENRIKELEQTIHFLVRQR